MKTFKLVDSTNNYCLTFELYVAIDEPRTSDFGKTHNLVVRLIQEYIGKSYIIFMDNLNNRKGVPKEFCNAVLKKKGDSKIMSYSNDISIIKIYDRKAVTLMSTV